MVIVGVEKNGEDIEGFYYNDPDDENKKGNNCFVGVDTFRKHWRKFAIFVD
jgi:hypothetical protein